MAPDPSGPQLLRGWQPGLIGWIVAEHAAYYSRQWNLGLDFEAMVARDLAGFALAFDPLGDLILCAADASGPLGAIAVQSQPDASARIRFFILADRGRGRGVGRSLLHEAMAFVAAGERSRAWLTTFAGLDAARHLYEQEGFRLVHEAEDATWGRPLLEQRFEWSRASLGPVLSPAP